MRRLIPMMCAAMALVMLGACAERKSVRTPNVWDLYDVRYPVPAGSNVPVSRATIYNRYQTAPAGGVPQQPYPPQQYRDNDAFYTPPGFGQCGSGAIGCAE